MSHCHEEHSHSHSHGDDGHNHDHDHSDDITPALQNLLYEQIDFDAVRTLNEKEPDTGRGILQKTWAQRLDLEPELESDADEQIILFVPFTGQVRLHSIHIRTSPSPSAPQTLEVHLNADDLDFSTIDDITPTQTFTLSQTADIQEIPVKRTLYNNCRSLTLFFKDNFSAGEEDVTRVSYVAFKGDFMKLNKQPINFLYEAAARPSDHKVKGTAGMDVGMGLGGGGRQGF